ncbi:hypothetical protein HK099_005158 [Clydaea vesicula]|uniref:C3H1-type domain-containing protein n=1 Tax=Clydaea vesicula TaxID=447962 RepID=A0AAD5TZ57_9FUNG|nr:hypothetical protein HK099_005158 [Clydaea vesicula]KAJ3382488.1 hypothetical protein HDU92_004748 [Lobulomyces angularis]
MPPKKSKVVAAKKAKVEDKTFGLKNKKGAKVSKYVEQVKDQVAKSGKSIKDQKNEKDLNAERQAKKKLEEEKKMEMAALFKTTLNTQKVPFGVDPKTVLCLHFKAGHCAKKDKCKFSHDLDIERKGTKIDLYTDARSEKKNKEDDGMEGWDQNKLESVVSGKDEKKNLNNPTEIVCKHFLDAVETRKYGWFWSCPSGDDCKYRHRLPPGYVLKKKETPEEKAAREEKEKENEITIEDFLETERHKLVMTTPITEESFMKWKAERKRRQKAEDDLAMKKKSEAIHKVGKAGLSFSGKELFDFNPDWAQGGFDEEDAMDIKIRGSDEEDNEEEDEISKGINDLKLKGQNSIGNSWEVIDSNNIDEDLFEEEDLEGLDDDDDDNED